MSVRLTVILFLLPLIGLLSQRPAHAEERPWSLKKQVLLSRLIVRGKVVSVSDRVVEVTRSHLVKAYQARVQVSEVVKGTSASAQIVVYYRRHIGKPTAFPEVTIRPGKEYVFYLATDPRKRLGMISPYFGAVRNYYGLIGDIRALVKSPTPARSAPSPKRAQNSPKRAPGPPSRPKATPRPAITIPPTDAPTSVGGLLAVARIEKSQVRAGQPLKLWLVLKNTGGKTLDLYFHTLDRFATFEIYRKGPTAAKLSAENPAAPDPPQASAYVPLELGAYVYTSVPLSKLVKLTAGDYQARVRVEIPALYAGARLGKAGWTGTVFSSWVTFTVTGTLPRPAARQSWRAAGQCDTTHLGALEYGKCGRCGSRSSSKTKKLCVFCADELGICAFCLRRADG